MNNSYCYVITAIDTCTKRGAVANIVLCAVRAVYTEEGGGMPSSDGSDKNRTLTLEDHQSGSQSAGQ
jgi:hypothetical protein